MMNYALYFYGLTAVKFIVVKSTMVKFTGVKFTGVKLMKFTPLVKCFYCLLQ
jgi:hypothetical protein